MQHLTRRTAIGVAAAGTMPAAAERSSLNRNVIVFKQPGRYGGWPANHGIWPWGNEIVVGFTAAHYKPTMTGHAVDREKPFEDWQARSLDGGETWTIEVPPALVPPEHGGTRPGTLDQPIHFKAAGFALMFRQSNIQIGPTRFYVSSDRCKTWQGPYLFTAGGIDKVASRTDYIVISDQECLMFGSAAKANDREGRVFCARTLDGGLTWKLVSTIGPEPAGYLIMPSSIALGRGKYLTAIRHKDPDKPGSIDAYRSDDDGRTWTSLGQAAANIGSGNPPSLLRLLDGRIALAFGYRAKPFGMRARVSRDEGKTWSDDIVLRDDGLTGDLGYPRSIQRPDGKVVTIYYYNGPQDSDRAIEATIWKP